MKRILGLTALLSSPLVLTALVLGFPSNQNKKLTNSEKAAATVMITNSSQSSGGTGVIYRSQIDASYILTNKHVCGVVKFGGLVKTEQETFHSVISYQESEVHDICLIKVHANLGVNTDVAERRSFDFEKSIIVGHPNLFPTVVTEGTFSGRKRITVMLGKKACTAADFADPAKSLYCIFMGGLPILKDFESQIVSSTIMPGSSGSAVYNTDGEIEGLAFAGQGEGIGYAFIVPIEYVYNFVHKELLTIKPKFPGEESEATASRQTKYFCSVVKNKSLKAICEMKKKFNKDILNDIARSH